MYKNIKNQCNNFIHNTNDIKENQKSILLWHFSRFFYKLECNEEKCRSDMPIL